MLQGNLLRVVGYLLSSFPLLQQRGILGAVVSAGAAVMQRLSCLQLLCVALC